VRDEILEAATVCRVYDPQVNGLCADWLAPLCEAAGLVDVLVARTPPEPGWDLSLHCALLRELARFAPGPARHALRQMCGRAPGSSDVYACDEVIDLEGADGLALVAARLGAAVQEDPSFWVDEQFLERFDELHGAGEAGKLLEARAQTNGAVRAYVDAVGRSRGRGPQRRPISAREPLSAVLTAIAGSEAPLYSLTMWGREASLEEREAVQSVLETRAQPVQLVNALRVYRRQPLPRVTPGTLALLSHPDATVRSFAATALAPHHDTELRRAALAAIDRGDLVTGVEALRGSLERGDVERVVEALNPVEDEDEQHSVVMVLRDLCAALQEPSVPLSLYVYDRSPCMHCRAEAVDGLVMSGAAPAWVFEEGEHDASRHVRDAVAGRGGG
jgi:hypothetical protein